MRATFVMQVPSIHGLYHDVMSLLCTALETFESLVTIHLHAMQVKCKYSFALLGFVQMLIARTKTKNASCVVV